MKRNLVLTLCAVVLAVIGLSTAHAVVDVQLNLRYDDPANEAAGGAWDLLVQSDTTNGIAGVSVDISNIDLAGITQNAAMTSVFEVFDTADFSGVIQIVTGDDLVAIATGVGTGSGSPGNVAQDDLYIGNSPVWDNSALLASGTFGSLRPVIEATTSANEYDAVPDPVAAAIVDMIVRGDGVASDTLLLGDANRDGTVSIADFSTLQNNFNQSGGWDDGDFNSTGDVTIADFSLLQNNFNNSAGSPAVAGGGVGNVPEPSSIVLLATLVGFGSTLRRRRR